MWLKEAIVSQIKLSPNRFVANNLVFTNDLSRKSDLRPSKQLA